jgi:hypothetical protein
VEEKKRVKTAASETRATTRDYCEACGYTDSHDPNCPRPRDSDTHDKRVPKSAPMPTDDELEAALRSEYGGTPSTDALLDVVLPMLRPSVSAIEPLSEQELKVLIDYHDDQDAGAEAQGYNEASLYHAKRSAMYSAMRNEIRKLEADTLAKMR